MPEVFAEPLPSPEEGKHGGEDYHNLLHSIQFYWMLNSSITFALTMSSLSTTKDW